MRNHPVGIKPGSVIQVAGPIAYRWLTHSRRGLGPGGEGCFEVGEAGTRFRVGDRVRGHAVGADKGSNRRDGAFPRYTSSGDHWASPMPDTLPYKPAPVLPLAVSTASCGLFDEDDLALRHPLANTEPRARPMLIWGGSTSVGSNAIQLAVDPPATTSFRPHRRGTSRTASRSGHHRSLDYDSPTIVEDIIIAAFQGTPWAR